MKGFCHILFLVIIFSYQGLAQGKKDSSPLLIQLESEVAKGNLIALRDLGSLLDKKTSTQ